MKTLKGLIQPPTNSRPSTFDQTRLNTHFINTSFTQSSNNRIQTSPNSRSRSFDISRVSPTKSRAGSINYFGTSSRFPDAANRTFNTGYVELPSALSTKAAVFTRSKRPGIAKSNSKYVPGPGQYNIQFDTKKSQGKTFGLSFQHYKKMIIPDVVYQELQPKNVPGPGHYHKPSMAGTGKFSATLKSNVVRFPPPKYSYTPSPVQYQPKNQTSARFLNISFGKGDRNTIFDQIHKRSITPGPGHYRSPSKIDTRLDEMRNRKAKIESSKFNRTMNGGSRHYSKTEPY